MRKIFRIFLIAILGHCFALPASAGPSSFVYSGRILKPDYTPLEASSVFFTVQIFSPGTEDCLLFEETFSVNMANSDGIFSLPVGTGQRNGTQHEDIHPLSRALDNTLAGDTGLSCASGMAYDPNPGDTRRIRITFDEGAGRIALDPMIIRSVPYAMNASKVGGKSASDLLQVSASDNLTQDNLESVFTGTGFGELLDLISGDSSNYAKTSADGAAQLPPFTTASPPSTPGAGDMWYDSTSGEIKYHDGTTTQTLGTAASSGTVTSITVGSGLVDGSGGNSNITSTGTIALPDVGTAGTYFKVTTDAKGRVSSGATSLVEADIPELTSAGNGVDGGAITQGTIGGTTAINTSGSITTSGLVSSGQVSTRSLTVYDSDNTHAIVFNAPATGDLTSNYLFTLPVNDGDSGQVLRTDGTGILSWVDVSSMSVGQITSGTGEYFTYMPNGVECADGAVMKWVAASDQWECGADNNVVTSVFTRTGDVTAQSGDYTATQITNSASGDIAGTTVQSAINELDVEKQPASVELDGVSALLANGLVERTGLGTYTTNTVTTAGKALLDDNSAADQRATLGLGDMAQETAADYLTKAGNLSGLADTSVSRTNLGLGDIAVQDASSVAITGGTIDGAAIGATTPASGDFTTLSSTGDLSVGGELTVSGDTSLSGNLAIAPQKTVNLGVFTTAQQTTLVGALAVTDAGKFWYNSDTEALMYWNGAPPAVALGVSGSGVQSLSGDTSNAQTLTIENGATVAAPIWDHSGTGDHKLQLPLASDTGVTHGLISKTDYDNFAGKLASESDPKMQTLTTAEVDQLENIGTTALSAAQWGYLGAMTAQPLEPGDTIPVSDITSATGQYFSYMPNGAECGDGQVLKWVLASDQWVCADDDDSSVITSVFGRTGAITADAGDYTAAKITNSASGTIAATTVQAALNELDSDKVAKAGDAMTGALGITGSADAVQLSVQANATQTTNLNIFEAKNSAGTVVGSIRADGTITAATNLATKSYVDAQIGSSGDITSVGTAAGSGLSGGVTSGDAALGIVVDTTTIEINGSNELQLTDSGVTANTYKSVTVDAKGRITAGTNPTTLSGYGITDAVTNAGGAASIQAGADASRGLAGTADRLYFSTDTQEIYRDNGTSWDMIASVGSGMTSLNGSSAASQSFATPGTSGSAPSWSTNAAAGVHTLNIPLAADTGVAAGLLSKAQYDVLNAKLGATLASGQILVGNGSNAATAVAPSGDLSMTNAGAFTVTKVQGRTVASTAPLDGQVYVWNNTSTEWQPKNFGVGDLKTSTGASQFAASCAAGQTLTWSAVTDAFSCTTISITKSQVSDFPTLGTAAAKDFGTAAGNLVELDSGAKIPTSLLPAGTATQWTTSGSDIYYSGGNVGIGTLAPGTTLDVAGAITSRPSGTLTGQTGRLVMRELVANGTATALIRAPDALASSYALTLPTSAGSSNQVLTTDGAGILSWTTPSTTPGANSLDFTHFANAMTLDASTNITASGTNVLSVTNTGTGNSFLVNDEASDTTPFVIDASGNVGIGTPTPGVNLEVSGAAAMPASSGTTQTGPFRIGSASTSYVLDFGVAGSIGSWIQSSNRGSLGSSGPLLLNPRGGEAVVSIGSTAPPNNAGFHLKNSAATYSNAAAYGIHAEQTLRARANNDTLTSVYINPVFNNAGFSNVAQNGLIVGSGNVGIGTTTPSSKLEVAGRISGAVTANANTLSSVTADFANANFVRSTAASGACGTLNFTNTTPGGSYTITIVGATTMCSTVQWAGATTNVKLPSGYTAGATTAGIVYTAIDDGSVLWVSAVPF